MASIVRSETMYQFEIKILNHDHKFETVRWLTEKEFKNLIIALANHPIELTIHA